MSILMNYFSAMSILVTKGGTKCIGKREGEGGRKRGKGIGIGLYSMDVALGPTRHQTTTYDLWL